jgi:hypothetical protein
MTNERLIGRVMIEQVLSGRNGNARSAHGSAAAVRATARTALNLVPYSARRMTRIGAVREVSA